MADDLFDAGMDIVHAVGEGAAREFRGFLDVYCDIPEPEVDLGLRRLASLYLRVGEREIVDDGREG